MKLSTKLLAIILPLLSISACANTKIEKNTWVCTVESFAGNDLYLSPPVEKGDSVTLNFDSLQKQKTGKIVFEGNREYMGNKPFIPFTQPFKLTKSADRDPQYHTYVSQLPGTTSTIIEAQIMPNKKEAIVSIRVAMGVIYSIAFLDCRLAHH